MIIFSKILNQKEINPLIIIIYILNFLIISSIFTHSLLFYLEKKILLLSNSVIIFSLTALFLKLLYWQSIKKRSEFQIYYKKNYSKLFLLRATFCIFTYITPAYYIFKQTTLVMNNDIISITLIIIFVIAFTGILIERYLHSEEKRSLVTSPLKID